MPAGSLRLRVTDLVDGGVEGDLQLPLTRAEGGSTSQETATFPLAGETVLTMEDITCEAGFGTTYTVALTTSHFRRYLFNQLIKEDVVNKANESPVRLVVKPKAVRDIRAPAPSGRLAEFLRQAAMMPHEDEDRDLVGLSGGTLYDALGPLRKACLLNIFKKAGDKSAGGCGSLLLKPLVLRQDRCFCMVDEAMVGFLNSSKHFKSACSTLHHALQGFHILEKLSYKSKDSHANLQVTLMRNDAGEFAADVDIDEATGFEHGFEVIRNHIGKQRTNPYLVRELLLLQDPVRLNPRYQFVF